MDITKKIALSKLYFDPNNPRLPVQLQGECDESKIMDHMLKNENVQELVFSIGEMGYSDVEPLLVVEVKTDEYIVVEGNRRLAALKLLNNPTLAKIRKNTIAEAVSNATHHPEAIPCIVYPSREATLDYLGYRHITGVKDWGAREKAIYLDQLYNLHFSQGGSEETYKKLAKMIGSRADYVAKLHKALKLFEKANEDAYYGLDIDKEDISFSWITTALGYNSIAQFIGLDTGINSTIEDVNEKNYALLFTWLFDKKKQVVKESRQISQLAKIVSCEDAIKRLELGGTIEEALLYTSHPEEVFMNLLQNAKYDLKQAKDVIEQLSEEPSEADRLLVEIERITKSIYGAISANFRE